MNKCNECKNELVESKKKALIRMVESLKEDDLVILDQSYYNLLGKETLSRLSLHVEVDGNKREEEGPPRFI